MFIGQYEHNLEEKGRLSIPSKFRTSLTKGGVITRGLDGCLFLFTRDDWEALVGKLSQTPLTKGDARGFLRLVSFGAEEVKLDGQGRILIPDFLRKSARLKKTVVVAGALTRLELWDRSVFDQYQKKIEGSGEEIAERLGELGIL